MRTTYSWYFIWQNSFLKTCYVVNYSSPLIIHVVKEILGEAFIITSHRYTVNTNIPARFLAAIIKASELKVTARHLCKKLFDISLLGDISNVVANIDDHFTILWPKYYFLTRRAGRVVHSLWFFC